MSHKTWYVTGNGDHMFRIVHQILCQIPDSDIIIASSDICDSTVRLMNEFPEQITRKNLYDPYDLRKATYVIFIDDEVISFDQLKRDAKLQDTALLTVRYSLKTAISFIM